MKNKYLECANDILENVGGKENIKSAFHCMTRFRVILKDESKIDIEKLKENQLVKGVNKTDDQYQVILGTGVVEKVFEEYQNLIGVEQKKTTVEEKDEFDMRPDTESKNAMQKLVRIMGDVFIPLLPAIIAAGILMGLRSFFVQLGYIDEGSTVYILSEVLTDTAYTFLPVLVAWSSMKRFGGNQTLGIVIGLMMINPLLPARAAIARDTADYLVMNLGPFHLNIAGFQGTVLPSLFIGMVGAYTYKYAKKVVPDAISQIFVPVITTFVSLVIGLTILGPVFSVVENAVVGLYVGLLHVPFGIGAFVAGFLQQFLVITGLHHALIVIDLNLLSTTGENIFIAIRNAGVFGQAGAALSIALFAKNKELRTMAGSSVFSAVLGITEPAIFGINLPLGKPFLFGAIGSGVGAMYGVILGLAAPGTVNGIPGFLQVLGDQYMMTVYITQSLISMIIPVIITSIYIKKKGI